MRISGTETLSLILSQTKQLNNLKVIFQVERNVPQVPKQGEDKRDGVIKPHNYIFDEL